MNTAKTIAMPEEGSLVEFHDGQNQSKAQFVMHADFESILKPTKVIKTKQKVSYIRELNQHISSGFCVNSKFPYGDVKDSLKLYRGEDWVEKFCDYIENEVKRLYYMFPEKPMKPLTSEE